jgi:hypothetical protein
VDTDDIKEEMDAESLLDSDDEAGKVYPEPMKDSGIDESFFSELDTVRFSCRANGTGPAGAKSCFTF